MIKGLSLQGALVSFECLLGLGAGLMAAQALALSHVGLPPHGTRDSDQPVSHEEDACAQPQQINAPVIGFLDHGGEAQDLKAQDSPSHAQALAVSAWLVREIPAADCCFVLKTCGHHSLTHHCLRLQVISSCCQSV